MTDLPVALVTGASRGLGAAIAARLAKDGFAVAVNYRSDGEAARRVAEEITAAGGTAEPFAADVTDERAVHELVAAIRARWGDVAALVINATGPQPKTPVRELSLAEIRMHQEFFVHSPQWLTRACLPGMLRAKHGRIVHIGSEISGMAAPEVASYAVAKAGQEALARAWAVELAPHGITVNTVAPGWIPVERHADVEAADFDRYRARVPSGQLGVPEDIAEAVAYFASPASGFTTGTRLLVEGGRHLT
ncbi:SDR family NAD(P)-dependent oxidoreductase [Allokutzneria oryzae]|uniref:SDR family NAD(P)-dependent oxidoreductase n=1 Tax=Allokutzneria oryzae TaxID=1378989 RepID=A0ABV5ZRN1_9PSEU